ncbi:MAG TPA: (2Fe-2S)-binding protein [Dehalococcoidia bacterium]
MAEIDGVMLTVAVNGRAHRLDVVPWLTAAELLRDVLGLTGTKVGCGVGECGACTVLVDGEPLLSCLLLAPELDGATVTTVEGLERDGLLPLQQAFLDEAATQCGFCTPGMIMAALSIPTGASDVTVREALAGNLCRCTGYAGVVRAVLAAGGNP